MAVILVSGDRHAGLELARELLEKSGLGSAKSSKREKYSPQDISSGVLNAYGLDPNISDSISQLHPGKVWEALSTDLMLANLKTRDWGWADANALHLLDHWRDFDPQTRFLLLYSSPEQAVAELVSEKDASPEEIETALDSWKHANAEIIRFYQENQDRCLLANAAFLEQNGDAFLELARDQFGANLKSVADADRPLPNRQAIHDLIAPSLVPENADIRAIYAELESMADLPAEGDFTNDGTIPGSKHNLLFGLDETDKSTKSRELAIKTLQQVRELEAREQAWLNELEELRERHEEGSKESELLLMQLHQVQEELEKTFTDIQGRELHISRLTGERDSLAEDLEQRRKDISRLTGEKDGLVQDLEKRRKDISQLRGEKEHLTKNLNAARKENTALSAEKAKLSAQLQDLHAKLSSLTSERDELRAESGEAKRRISDLSIKLANASDDTEKVHSLQNKLADTSKESELLLLQLHQVQEELELYFQKYQETVHQSPAAENVENASPSFSENDGTPNNAIVDFREYVDGDNWYYAEHDGRWAGPETSSTIKFSSLEAGNYELQLDVVDAMSLDILKGMSVSVNGQVIPLNWKGKLAASWKPLGRILRSHVTYPLQMTGHVQIDEQIAQRGPILKFDFPSTISPASRGEADRRNLAIRLREVSLTKS